MRIISGEFRGRKILSPRTLKIRPTSDRVRESLFNILRDRCSHTKVLDLFAGVGTLGLEAISRGANRVTFVDNCHQAVQYLKKNSVFCRDRVEVIPADAKQAIEILFKKKRSYEMIFLDPPYEQGWVQQTLEKMDLFSIFNSNFLIVVQHSKREEIERSWQNFCMLDRRAYGDTILSFFGSKQVRSQ